MYIESKSSKLRIIGYTLIITSFICFLLESVSNHYLNSLIYDGSFLIKAFPYLIYVSYLLLLFGTFLINFSVRGKNFLFISLGTLILGLPYPIEGILIISHKLNHQSLYLYDLFAIAVLMSIVYSLVVERKIYRLFSLLLLFEWFFFDYLIAVSGQYIFLGFSSILTDLVLVLLIIYFILEILLEKNKAQVIL